MTETVDVIAALAEKKKTGTIHEMEIPLVR